MNTDKKKKNKEAQVKKENQDFPNVPASSGKIKDDKSFEKQIKKTSELNPDGKTDNTDQNSEN